MAKRVRTAKRTKQDASPPLAVRVDFGDPGKKIAELETELLRHKQMHGREINENVELRRTMRAMAHQIDGLCCSNLPTDKFTQRELLRALALQLRAVADFGEIPF